MSLAILLWVHSKSKEVSYLSWQNTYPNLKTTCHIKLKFLLWTKLLENLLLTKYLISVAAPLSTTQMLTFCVSKYTDTLFYKQGLFSTQPQCCWTFLINPQMLHKCCLLHIDIILRWHLLDLVYLCLCLRQGLFMSYGCDLFFIIICIFIIIKHIISSKQARMVFFPHSQKFSLWVLLSICIILCQKKCVSPYIRVRDQILISMIFLSSVTTTVAQTVRIFIHYHKSR